LLHEEVLTKGGDAPPFLTSEIDGVSASCSGSLTQEKAYSVSIGLYLRNTTLGYGFHIQHIHFGRFKVEDLAHDSGRTLNVPNMVIPRNLQIPTIKEEIQRYSSQYSAHLSAHPNDLIANLMAL
jgi:hypothetical protein